MNGKFILINLVIMLGILSVVSRFGTLYASAITSDGSEVSSEVASNIDMISNNQLDYTNMTQEEIANYLDPDETSQDFIILDSKQLNNTRGYQLTALQSGYNLSTFNASLYGKFALYKVNGKYVYCIEPTSDIISIANKVSSNQSKYNYFSASSKNYIQRTISSAVGKYKKTKNTDYLFSAQLLIWEYLSTTNSDLANPWRIRNVEKYRAEISEIESDVKSWNTLPSFLSSNSTAPKVHTLKYDIKSDTFSTILTDSNGVWDSKYANYNSFNNYTLSNPSGANNVKISIKSEQLNTSSKREYKWTPELATTSEFYDASQDLVYIGAPPVKGYMALKTEKKPLGGFKVTKVNGETNELLAGAEYSLYDENGTFVQKYITNKSGGIDSGLSLVPGKYELVETNAPKGFVLDNSRHSISITNGKVIDYTSNRFKNDPIRGGFELNKVGVDVDGNKTPLANVEFTVTSSTYPDFKKVYTTNNQGNIKTMNNELLYGSYHIEETKVSNRYVANFKQDFQVNENNKIVILNANKPIENQTYVNKINITKVGQSFENGDITEYPLPGAQFKVYEETNEKNGIIDSDDIFIEELTTDKRGVAVSSYLPMGNYLVQESVAPEGYVLSEETYAFTVNKNSGKPNQSVIELEPIANEIVKGRATLTKYGVRSCENDVCQTPLDKVSFGIYKYNEDEIESAPLEIIVTDELGIAITGDLKYGKYYAKEVSNEHVNYTMTEDIYEFEITNNDSIVEINGGVAIENQEKLGQIKIIKSGQSLENGNDQTVLLNGAEYTIFDTNNNQVDVLTTDEGGESASIGLSFGKYTITETKAPFGYTIDSSIYNFEIDENNYENPIQLKFADGVISNSIQITKLDTVTNDILEGAKLDIRNRESNDIVESWVSTKVPYTTSLKIGEYEICETAAPVGYTRNITCENFEVKEHGITQKFNVGNKPINMTETGNDIFSYVIKLSVIIACLLLVKFVYNFKQGM